jgi:transcriptional regulator with XRE-family HTH domain
MTSDLNALGEQLTSARMAKGLSLRALAARLGYATHSELSAYERGRLVLPAHQVGAMAEVLGLDATVLGHLQRRAQQEREARLGLLHEGRLPPVTLSLPPRDDRFVGRDGLIDEVVSSIRSGEAITMLVGAEGVGKTAVAIEVAHRLSPEFGLLEFVSEQGVDISGERHLIVVDDVSRPGRLSAGHGVILGTARGTAWRGPGRVIRVPPLTRDESRAFMTQRLIAGWGHADLDDVAGALGDIPRALALACGYANEAAVTAPDYLTRLEGGEPAGLCYAFVERFSAPARELIAMLSFMGAGPTPTTLFTNWPMQLPPDLRDAVRDELGFRDAIALLTRLALVRTGVGQIEVPRPIRRASW